MKLFPNHLLAALALAVACFASPASAEDQPPLVEVEAHFIHATEVQMREALAAAGFDSATVLTMSPEQAAKVFQALKKKGADFFDSPRAVTRAGVEATVESVQEFRYPTEYNDVKETPGKKYPTAFETRNVGVTLIFKATISQAEVIDLTLNASAVSFRGFIDYSNAKSAATEDEDSISRLLKEPLREGGIWQPIFTHQTMKTQVTVTSGRQICLGGMSDVPQSSTPGVKTFLFITARLAEALKTSVAPKAP